jgi:5-hydroxyisourate hydrolase
MSAITTHILDTSKGKPASGVTVVLERFSDESEWSELGRGETDADGRLKNLLPDDAVLLSGTYRLTFETGKYFDEQSIESFYPQVTISFIIRDATQHYHVPLLLNPFGFSTYRGS